MKELKRGRNRGASLVSVIIAMSVVMLLGVSAIYVTYSNLNRKMVDRRSKNSAYTAESALDEIVAGLQAELSTAFNSAYAGVMSKYGNYSTSAEMNRDFAVDLITTLMDTIHQRSGQDGDTVVTENSNLYSLSLLKNYIEVSKYPGALTVSSDGENKMETLSDALVLRNVKVTYVENGYENNIITDIRIDVPKMYFTKVAALPNLGAYANIANGGVIVKSGGLTLTIEGEMYAGTNSNSTVPYSVHLENSAILDLTNCPLLTARSYIDSDANGGVRTGTGTSLWTADIRAGNKAVFSLLGNTYVQNDISMNGTGAKLTLGGSYFGLGDGSTADTSSAIIVNGRNVEIDMSALNTLVLMGTAYVGGSEAAGTVPSGVSGGNQDIKTGESIAVKSNQLAYLVPTECEGIVANPMSYEQYRTLTNNGANTSWAATALDTVIPSLGTNIRSYGNVVITPVFTPEQGGAVYLFLNFANKDAAATYFMDIYKSQSRLGDQLREYLPLYLKEFIFPVEDNAEAIGLTRLVTGGNYLLPGTFNYDTLQWEGDPSYSSGVSISGSISNELSNYKAMYKALCAKLVTSSAWLTDEELSQNVYQNLINTDKINAVLALGAAGASNGAEITVKSVPGGKVRKIVFQGSGNTKVIIVDNPNSDYKLDATETATGGIIITTGTLEMTRNWEGVVICGGQLRITTSSVTIKANSSRVGEALRLHCDLSGGENLSSVAVTEFLAGGEAYLSDSEEEEEDMKDVSSCISLQNWRTE